MAYTKRTGNPDETAMPMTSNDLRTCLTQLGLTQTDAAALLSVAPRTVRRWAEDGAEVAGPAEHALRAWTGLQRRGLPWHPDDTDADQIARHRENAIELYELLLRVEQRGGPSDSWTVDIDKGVATLGPMRVSFCMLRNGGFSPASYRRTDRPADLQRDWPFIEDAFACVAKAFAERPAIKFAFLVTLQNGNVVLWDVQKVPTIVLEIDCELFRRTICPEVDVTDEQCRLLVECNKDLVCELAERMYAANRYQTREDRIRVLTATADDLATIADRFSLCVIQVMPIWVETGTKRLRGRA